MKILFIVVCLFWLWMAYEMYTAPCENRDKALDDYESDEDALF